MDEVRSESAMPPVVSSDSVDVYFITKREELARLVLTVNDDSAWTFCEMSDDKTCSMYEHNDRSQFYTLMVQGRNCNPKAIESILKNRTVSGGLPGGVESAVYNMGWTGVAPRYTRGRLWTDASNGKSLVYIGLDAATVLDKEQPLQKGVVAMNCQAVLELYNEGQKFLCIMRVDPRGYLPISKLARNKRIFLNKVLELIK